MTMNKFVSGFLATRLLTGCASKSPSPTVSSPKITATAAYVPSDNSAYVVFDLAQKTFLEGKNFSLVRPIASVTKLMTAIVFFGRKYAGKACQTAILPSDADLNNPNALARTEFTEMMLAKYQCPSHSD